MSVLNAVARLVTPDQWLTLSSSGRVAVRSFVETRRMIWIDVYVSRPRTIDREPGEADGCFAGTGLI
jgi:hypothetical protein